MNFSLEITTKTDLNDLPSIKDIYVVFSPGSDFMDIVRKCDGLSERGFNPVPHFPARSIRSEKDLKEYVRLVIEAGTQKVLIIGGDRDPIGPYHCSMQLIETGLFDSLEIAIAGHPEGSVNMSNRVIDEAMAQKIPFATHIVTQWTQNTEKIKRFVEKAALPVHIGVAGPATIQTLVRFAKIMGLGNSMKFAFSNASRVANLLSTQTPDVLIRELDPWTSNFHIYAFGGVKKINEWLTINEYV